jgi:energy-coupling factor transporter ATP-binding protein EcfA2
MNSPRRITLSRIVAVNWYGYRQFIDVNGLSLITGANGSGKSALLDLIQFVMLGEQLSRFNKAAAGAGSGRTLRGYCLCDTNTISRDGNERFLRSSGVTFAALEFAAPPNASGDIPRQTWGARIEYDSPTAKGSIRWFRAPCRLEKADFLRVDLHGEEEFLSDEEFRVHLKRDLEGDCWEHQRTYLEEMRQRTGLHFDREQMNKTLPKAMAFQPESNFEAFIRDYLLEVSLPDVRAVKASVEAHNRAKLHLEKMHDQHQRLGRICQLHEAAASHRRESALWYHLADALQHEEALEKLEGARQTLRKVTEDSAQQVRDREDAITERNELEDQLTEVRLVVGNDSQLARLSENRERLRKLKEELTELREARKTASQFLQTHGMHWKNWLRLAESLHVDVPREVHELLGVIRGNDESKGLDAVARLGRQGDELLEIARERLRELRAEIEKVESRDREVQRDLEHYREGRSAPSPLLDALRARGQKVSALGRVVEVKAEAEAWWPLLESLLAQDRQAILPEDFAAAWEEAQRTPSPGEPLIHPEEVRAKAAKSAVQAGSVREFLETKHSGAAAYLDGLLGNLMPVDHTHGLTQHPRALSRDGWLKDPPRRVRLVPAKELTLGEEGLRRMREVRETELRTVREQLSVARRQHADWQGWANQAETHGLIHPTPPDVGSSLRRLPEVEKECHTLDETIRLLATPEREATVEKLRKLEAAFKGASERAIRLEERLGHLDLQQRELRDRIATLEEEENSLLLSRHASRAKLTGVLETEITTRLAAAKSEKGSWAKRRETALVVANHEANRAAEATRSRDAERQQFAAAHPDIAEAFDAQEEDNERYASRLRQLAEQELDRYKAEAAQAQKEWEERLQHQVLDVLKEKLDEADRTKRELNKAMAHDIGGMRYQITSQKDRTHTAIWELVDGGIPTGEQLALFNHSKREELEKAKLELMAAIEAADNPEDKRGQRALDYRYYHHWDIEARPTGKGDGAAISLNKSAKKQSGGENQAPFFVATLAAFHRVYDVSTPNGPPTLGLVVMDEAFSKLSGDRIDDCLELAQNFGLQLVMAFPEDRLPTMIEHADTVVQCRVERAYDDATGSVSDIQNWVVRVDRDRLREAFA